MKLLASDFDGTLFVDGKIAEETVKAIQQWQKKGNWAGIVTGRNLHFLQSSLNGYPIKWDFYVCSTGGAIYDRFCKLIAQNPFSKDALKKLMEHSALKTGRFVMGSAPDGSYFYGEKSVYEKLKKELNIQKVDWDALFSQSLNQVSSIFSTPEEARECTRRLNEELGQWITAYQNIECVDVAPLGGSKAEGLDILLSRLTFCPDEIFAIGDSFNDLSMIERFSGYTVENAEKEIQKKAKKVYDSVGTLIYDHM